MVKLVTHAGKKKGKKFFTYLSLEEIRQEEGARLPWFVGWPPPQRVMCLPMVLNDLHLDFQNHFGAVTPNFPPRVNFLVVLSAWPYNLYTGSRLPLAADRSPDRSNSCLQAEPVGLFLFCDAWRGQHNNSWSWRSLQTVSGTALHQTDTQIACVSDDNVFVWRNVWAVDRRAGGGVFVTERYRPGGVVFPHCLFTAGGSQLGHNCITVTRTQLQGFSPWSSALITTNKLHCFTLL